MGTSFCSTAMTSSSVGGAACAVLVDLGRTKRKIRTATSKPTATVINSLRFDNPFISPPVCCARSLIFHPRSAGYHNSNDRCVARVAQLDLPMRIVSSYAIGSRSRVLMLAAVGESAIDELHHQPIPGQFDALFAHPRK